MRRLEKTTAFGGVAAGIIKAAEAAIFAGIITIAPALAFALSGTSAFPRVLALSSTKPVLRFIDVAINHKLSGLLVRIPVVFVHGLLVGEEFTEMIGESLSSRCESNNSKNEFHF